MTRKDYILIAKCIAECYINKYNLDDMIDCFANKLDDNNNRFDYKKFRRFILQYIKPDYIPDEQAQKWTQEKESVS